MLCGTLAGPETGENQIQKVLKIDVEKRGPKVAKKFDFGVEYTHWETLVWGWGVPGTNTYLDILQQRTTSLGSHNADGLKPGEFS